MALHELSTKTLIEIEHGGLAAALDNKLKDAIRDMKDRPHVSGKRKVTLVIELAPKFVDNAGGLEDVKAAMKVKLALPELNTREYVMGARGDKVVFNDLSPQDPNQRTLDMLQGSEGEA